MEMVTCQRETFSPERATGYSPVPGGSPCDKCRVVSGRRAGLGIADSQTPKARNNIETLVLSEGEWM